MTMMIPVSGFWTVSWRFEAGTGARGIGGATVLVVAEGVGLSVDTGVDGMGGNDTFGTTTSGAGVAVGLEP